MIVSAVIHKLMQGHRAIVHCDNGRQFPAALVPGVEYEKGSMVLVDTKTKCVVDQRVILDA